MPNAFDIPKQSIASSIRKTKVIVKLDEAEQARQLRLADVRRTDRELRKLGSEDRHTFRYNKQATTRLSFLMEKKRRRHGI